MEVKPKGPHSPKSISIETSEVEILRRIQQIEELTIDDDLRDFLKDALWALLSLDQMMGMKDTTIKKLRSIFGKKIERRAPKNKPSDESGKKRGNNKGKNGAKKYTGAKKICHKHGEYESGDTCPECLKGKLYIQPPGLHIKIQGGPPLSATIHETEKFRCNGCGTIFEAKFPEKDDPKYDSGAIAIIGLLKYGLSLPFYRNAKFQAELGVPVPASTQWDLVKVLYKACLPIHNLKIKLASNSSLFYEDDTTNRVQSLIEENKEMVGKKKGQRKGIYTSGILAEDEEGHPIMLYFTGRKYAGENLKDILLGRDPGAGPPIVMSDALPSNSPAGTAFIKALCNTHGRRNFYFLLDQYEEECNFVLDRIAEIYRNEKLVKKNKLNKTQRLEFHRENSLPRMVSIKEYCTKSLDEEKVEENSSLGKAMKYFIKHWDGLTAFCRVVGAPIDNNKLEQKLRVIVLNRKNYLFYKTEKGSLAADIITSLVKTCELNGVNSYKYLVYILDNKEKVEKDPESFLPWAVDIKELS